MWDGAAREGRVGGCARYEAVQPHGTPPVRRGFVGDEIPAGGPDHEVVRFEGERGGVAVAGVLGTQEMTSVDRGADGVDQRGVDGWRRELPVVPGRRDGERTGVAAAAFRHHVVQRRQGTGRVLADAGEDRRGGLQGDGGGDRLVLVEDDGRESCGAAEPVAASGAAYGLDVIAEVSERVDVAPHGSPRDPEPGGQFLRRQSRAGAEDRQQCEGPCGGVGHARSSHR
ncbi:hypothetical protein GCM10023223_30220 [Stackebrandtia albiflava]